MRSGETLTSDSHDAVITSLHKQMVDNEFGWDRLGGCWVDSGAIILNYREFKKLTVRWTS